MTSSTRTLVPTTNPVVGTGACAEPSPWVDPFFRPTTAHDHALARAATPGYHRWLNHVAPAAGCTQPVRLYGHIDTVDTTTGQRLTRVHTSTMPDAVIYKPCGNRRASVCPSCSDLYRRDAYQILRAGLVGGKGVPDTVAAHPAVFPTLTAPSFGPVHTRHVTRHTCGDRRLCDCRPEPCHPRRLARCAHGQPAACFARHGADDKALGRPLCLDCYDHDHQVVWNLHAGELWRRTLIAIHRYLRRLARQRGIGFHELVDTAGRVRRVAPFRLTYGKVAEMQRRAVVHYHAIARLDGHHPDQPDAWLPPPAGLNANDLVDAVEHAARTVRFHTPAHPDRPDGWEIGWGEQTLTRVITVAGSGEITDGMVAAYLAKYATKATEITGHTSRRLDEETVDVFADPDGTHTQRLVEACWMLGRPRAWRGLRRWAHMLGFGGHFLTKSRRYSVTFRLLREHRLIWRRTQTTGPAGDGDGQAGEQPTTLVINFLQFVGAGWHTTGDALLANTSAAMARAQRQAARDELATAN